MKRGMEIAPSTLIAIIMIAMASIALFVWWSSLQSIVEKGTDLEVCQTTVAAADKLKSGTGGVLQFVEIDCPTQHITIKADGAYRRSLRSKDQTRYLSSSQVEQRLKNRGIPKPTEKEIAIELGDYVVANEMAVCWNEFGEGALNPFKSGVLVSDDRCVTCAVIDFDESYRKAVGDSSIKGFTNYLKEVHKDDSKTYYEYLRPQLAELNTVGKGVLSGVAAPISPLIYDFLQGKNLPLNSWLIDANGQPRVPALENIYLGEPLVVTFTNRDAAWFAKWGVDKVQAAVMIWPASASPGCDSLY